MLAILSNSWTLFLGLAFLVAGNGLMFPLLGLRASMEGFSPAVIGLVMTGYPVGFVFGTQFCWRTVRSVGHIRTFGAMAAVASAAALAHLVLIEPVAWGLTRIAYGFCFAALYVVAESWLNASASNETRGQTMAAYMFVQLGAFAAGQMLLGLADPGGVTLFILASIMISVAVVPMLLTVVKVPESYTPEHMNLRDVYRISSIGVIGCFTIGVVQGAFWNMGVVYGEQIGLAAAQVGFFMAVLTVGGMLVQLPIGYLSDRMGRPRLIILLSLVASATAALIAVFNSFSLPLLYLLSFIYGGMMLSVYGVCVALTNDYLEADQVVPVSSTLVMLFGAGSIVGPLLGSLAIELLPPHGLFVLMGGINGGYALFVMYRLSRNIHIVDVEDSNTMGPVTASMSPVATAVTQEAIYEDDALAAEAADADGEDATSAINAD